ncbi:auxin-responsive protein IAA6-like isoform X2 [Phragmites australis]|uniref:auxin-responsive protein IAA6-like isoform X2 n=1 Tax=Phragmites australis TaxID=29695 RepID=UPI002D7A3FD1|nr:auxin-responsive protein IAA6-like isoform X2 [Phragmites australis]
MEDSKTRETLPRLLDLIPDEKEWKEREAQGPGRSRNTGFGDDEDKNLELKLGLPGLIEEKITAVPRDKGILQESPVLSLGYFPNPSKSTINTTTTGTKRGFLDTVEAKAEGCNEQKQQVRAGCANELALEEKIAAAGERKKGCCPPPPSHAPPAASVRNSGNRTQAQGRGASAPVVGWPPIRSFRRNLANSSSSKQTPEPPNGETSVKTKLTSKKNPLVKINMDGIPIGRKVDLAAYDSYEKLSVAVKELFHGFLEAQKDISGAESAWHGADEKIFSQLLDGSGEYTLAYEDNEGDMMLVRDVPWNAFISTAKRLRVLRSSELSHGLIGAALRRVANC